MTEHNRLILVDGSGYIFRAFFALPPMTRGDGTPVNAVFGFSNMLLRLLQEREGDDLVVVFDAGATSFRNEIYADYKANRDAPPPELVPQFELVRQAARAFDLPVVEIEGYEADDIIATFASRAREVGQEVVIVSSDKDLMQLVTDGISLWDPIKQRVIDREAVIEKFGVGPELVRDAQALIGDTSDNVPGVPGIGPKTAAQLIAEHGSLEGLLANLDKIKQPKRRASLEEHAQTARLSYKLVSLDHDVPLPFDPAEHVRKPMPREKLHAFFLEMGFRSLTARFAAAAADGTEAAGAGDAGAAGKPGEMRFETITDTAVLERIAADAGAAGWLAIDTETTSLNIAKADLVGLCLAVDPGHAFYLPLAHIDDFGQKVAGQLDLAACRPILAPLLADRSVLKIGHNIKYDLSILRGAGFEVTPIEDTMLISYVLDGSLHGHGMDELASRHLAHQTIAYSDVCGKGKSQITFDRVPIDKATAYAAEDAAVTLRLWQHLKRKLFEQRMLTVYERFERPLAPIVAAMEAHGIAVDRHHLQKLSSLFTQRMAELEERAYKLAGRTFNIGSPKQLGEILFDEMAVGAGAKKTKTGAHATGADILEELAAQGHELPKVVLDWRQLQKLTRTYTDALVEEIAPRTGRIHTSYMMAATNTGRLSSTDPNLQNIPIRTEEGRRIREAFIADDGFVLLSADYSQIELRVLAHMADIKALKDAFEKDADIHAITAAQMFKKDVSEIGADLRRSAKTINYGIIYGIGAFGLSQRLGIPQADAKAYIDAYFEQYPGIKAYMDRAKGFAKEHGYVTTLFGRRCHLPEITSKLPARRSYAERAAINAPIQGSAADIMKRAMIRTAARLDAEQAGARMLLQVHDELVFEVPKDEVEATTALVRETMGGAAALTVPLIVDVGHGTSWAEAH